MTPVYEFAPAQVVAHLPGAYEPRLCERPDPMFHTLTRHLPRLRSPRQDETAMRRLLKAHDDELKSLTADHAEMAEDLTALLTYVIQHQGDSPVPLRLQVRAAVEWSMTELAGAS